MRHIKQHSIPQMFEGRALDIGFIKLSETLVVDNTFHILQQRYVFILGFLTSRLKNCFQKQLSLTAKITFKIILCNVRITYARLSCKTYIFKAIFQLCTFFDTPCIKLICNYRQIERRISTMSFHFQQHEQRKFQVQRISEQVKGFIP